MRKNNLLEKGFTSYIFPIIMFQNKFQTPFSLQVIDVANKRKSDLQELARRIIVSMNEDCQEN